MRKKTDFGHYISGLGITVSELSRKSGISRPPLVALVYGKAKGIQFCTVERLCSALNISVDTLFRLVNSEPTALGRKL